jgi:ribonuclease HI
MITVNTETNENNENTENTSKVNVEGGPDSVNRKICDCQCDDILPSTADVIWIGTDGATIANGKNHCIATWGYYLTNGIQYVRDYGIIPTVNGYVHTNNRGEIWAVIKSLEMVNETLNSVNTFNSFNTVNTFNSFSSCKSINIITDSRYVIYSSNLAKDLENVKKNVDLVAKLRELLVVVGAKMQINFIHFRSHKARPVDIDSEECFKWQLNDIADHLCQLAKPRTI